MAKKKRGNRGTSLKSGIELYGVKELLKQIEDAGGKVDDACQKAANVTMKIVGEHSQAFMAKHKVTGDTYRSFELRPAQVKKGKIVAGVGYNIDNGGLPAIFLDVGATGTPKKPPQKGHYWRYYAVNDSGQIKKIKEAQHEAINEILGGLK